MARRIMVMKCFRRLWIDFIIEILTWQVGLYLMAQGLVGIVNYNHQHSENSGSRKARTLGTPSGTRPSSTRATMRRGRDEWIAEEPATHLRAFPTHHSFPFPFPPSHMPCLEMVPSGTKTNIPPPLSNLLSSSICIPSFTFANTTSFIHRIISPDNSSEKT